MQLQVLHFITAITEVKCHLCYYVNSEMKGNLPYYHVTKPTIPQTHVVDAAKVAIQFSKLDRVNVKVMVFERTAIILTGKSFFYPFIKKEILPSTSDEPSSSLSTSAITASATPDQDASSSSQLTQTLIWIHLEEWQQKRVKYRNTTI